MKYFSLAILICSLLACSCGGSSSKEEQADDTRLPEAGSPPDIAAEILADDSLGQVLEKAKAVLASGFNAGDGYGEVWIRDFATFIALSCEVNDIGTIRDNLLMFFKFQGSDGNIIDGYIPEAKGSGGYDYIRSDLVPGWLGHKNTVETDQESSLIQAVYTYVSTTEDFEFLNETVAGVTVLDRMERALEFLMKERYDSTYGLLWGATTADWGDVQPEHEWGVFITGDTHRAIDIYDNAMFVIAIKDYLSLLPEDSDKISRWADVLDSVEQNIRKHLWDKEKGKFIPHIYLNGSPFPADFDENAIWYHGGTAVAIQAGILLPDEIAATLDHMRENVRKSGAPTIGLTVYPPYPDGFFKNKGMGPYSYQNGGDWTWFGGRMIQALIEYGFIEDAYTELRPMIDRVLANDGFYEWYSVTNEPKGSGTFRGSAGVLGVAIEKLVEWAQSAEFDGR